MEKRDILKLVSLMGPGAMPPWNGRGLPTSAALPPLPIPKKPRPDAKGRLCLKFPHNPALWRLDGEAREPASAARFMPRLAADRRAAVDLAAFFAAGDEDKATPELPKTWGVDDIPVVFQDRLAGAPDHGDYSMDLISAAVGWFGDATLANGAIYPRHRAPRGWLRLRLFNRCQRRSLRLAADDGRPLYVVTGGLGAQTAEVEELAIHMGESFEVLADFGDGRAFDLVNLPPLRPGLSGAALCAASLERAVPVLRLEPSGLTGPGGESPRQPPALASPEDLPLALLDLLLDAWLECD